MSTPFCCPAHGMATTFYSTITQDTFSLSISCIIHSPMHPQWNRNIRRENEPFVHNKENIGQSSICLVRHSAQMHGIIMAKVEMGERNQHTEAINLQHWHIPIESRDRSVKALQDVLLCCAHLGASCSSFA